MDLQAPSTLFTAWILVPGLVVVASAGIGYGIALLSGMDLRGLTLPVGYLAAIALFSLMFFAGTVGVATVVVIVLLAVIGPAYAWRTGRGPRLPPRGERSGLLWGLLAALGAYGVAIVPIAGSGRSGVLGYVFNDDSAIHIALVQALSDGISGPTDIERDSYHYTTNALGSGYPVGSYAWPVFGRLIGGMDPFHLWTPICAVTLVMLALVAYSMLRRLGAPAPYAAVASVVIPCGNLVYAYHTQGGLKEVIMPVAIYASAALVARALEEGISGRTLIPAVVTAAAAVANLGYAGVAWIGPLALVGAAVLIWRYTHGRRVANLRNLVLFAAVGVLLALPAAISSLKFFRNSEQKLTDPNETGNLIDAISLWQTLNVWLTGDYRFKPTESPGFTYTVLSIAIALAVLGLVHAVRRRDMGLPFALIIGIAGSALISSRTSIYFDAKTYVALAPALGIATAAGVLLLWDRRLTRVLGLAAVGAVAVGVAWSALMIYAHLWITPKDRLGELATINQRFEGRADQTLVSDREQYALHFLRDIGPWDDWGFRQPRRGLNFPGGLPPTPDRAPDLDDYTLDHVNNFRFLLERKAPGGSRAPSNYRPIFETAHYRMWERASPTAREHLPYGDDGKVGGARVPCRNGEPDVAGLKEMTERARALDEPLVAAFQTDPAVTVIESKDWVEFDLKRATPAPGMVAGRGGLAATRPKVEPGRYEAWMQGSFGQGVRLTAQTPGADSRNVGDLFNDLGAPGWQRFGVVDVGPGTVLQVGGLGRPRVLAGSRHFNIMGPTKLVREGASTRIETIPTDSLDRLCGRDLDWVELPA